MKLVTAPILFNANNETYIIDEDNKVKNITSRYNKLLSKRIQIGIPRKDAIKLKNSKYSLTLKIVMI